MNSLNINHFEAKGINVFLDNNDGKNKAFFSYGQVYNYFQNHINSSNHIYYLPVCFEITGELNVEVLHESLKQFILIFNVKPIELIKNSKKSDNINQLEKIKIHTNIQSIHNISTQKVYIQNHNKSISDQLKFIDIEVNRIGTDKYFVIFFLHPFIVFNWSSYSLIKCFGYIYDCLIHNNTIDKNKLLNINNTQNSPFNNTIALSEESKTYWREKFSTVPECIELPIDLPANFMKKPEYSSNTFSLTNNDYDLLEKFCKKLNISLYTGLLAALHVLLYHYTNANDTVIGIDFSEKNWFDKIGYIGFHNNTLPLRSYIDGDISFRDYVKKFDDAYKKIEEYKDIPAESIYLELLKEAKITKDFTTNLITCSFDEKHETFSYGNLKIKPAKIKNSNKYCDFQFIKNDSSLTLHITFNKNIYLNETIHRIGNNFFTILMDGLKEPDNKITELNLISKEEKDLIINKWNRTGKNYSYNKLLHELFEQQVSKNPDKLAIVDGQVTLTFAQVNSQVNYLAHELLEKGIREGNPIGVLISRSYYSIISLMAILKVGAVYVPMDLSYPTSHIDFIMKETGLQLIITKKQYEAKIPESTSQLLYIDDFEDEKKLNELNFDYKPTINADDLSFIMFTSGTTGKPKGVKISQKQFLNRFKWLWKELPFESGDVACQRTNINFSPSIWEFCGALLKGFPTVVLSDDIVRDPKKLVMTLFNHKITRILVVPTLLNVILDLDLDLKKYLKHLKHWITCGEPLTSELYEKFKKRLPDSLLYNDYGSTETNGVMWFNASKDMISGFTNVPIGSPIGNMKAYILDKDLRPVPIGASGYIYIGGMGLAKGYLNQPELTEEKFIQNPFSDNKDEIIYKMGDIGRFLANGKIAYIGREDSQVKIRGIRIELKGIENVIASHPLVSETVVIAKKRQNNTTLMAAFVVFTDRTKITKEQLREYITKNLPTYMVPSRIIVLNELPKTPNGKIHRGSLFTHLNHSNDTKNNEPEKNTDDLKQIICSEIATILENKDGDYDDNLNFWELGIDSILIIELVNNINRKCLIDINVTSLFEYSTIQKLADYIAGLKKTEVTNSTNDYSLNTNSDDQDYEDAVAVIGMSGRFGDAENLEQYWNMLANSKDSIIEIPEDRWNIDDFYDPDFNDSRKSNSKWGGFLSNIYQFEPLFFNISPNETKLMDPQQRICLEECWNAIEDAGYSLPTFRQRKVGVFIGVRPGDYIENLNNNNYAYDVDVMRGNDSAILSGRISYYFDLIGPCLSVNTACSSSLVAVHLACESIKSGESDVALAGGVHITTTKNFYVLSSNMGMLSPDGKCYTFDDKANGFVPGEGAGIIVLKSLKAAVQDKDNIYGIIKGSGINQDGRTNGISVPKMSSQEELITSVYKKASVNAENISYIEAHGTATKLGDPIEFEALNNAFRKFTNKKQFCAIGSVKTNIGHSIAAAGIAGLIKILLSLVNEKLVPTLNFTQHNKYIDFDNSPFFVNTTCKDWPIGENERVAGISSFGYSGTNAHLVLEEAPKLSRSIQNDINSLYLIPLSAISKNSLIQKVKQLYNWLNKNKNNHRIQDIAYTLCTGRTHFNLRTAFVVNDTDDLLKQLKSAIDNNQIEDSSAAISKQFVKERFLLFQEFEKWLVKDMLSDEGTITDYNKLDSIRQMYITGFDLNMNDIFNNMNCYRIPMPTYPFNKEEYSIVSHNKISPITKTTIDNAINGDDSIKIMESGFNELNELGTLLLLAYFRSSGFFTQSSQVYNISEVREALHIISKYHRLFDSLIDILVHYKYIIRIDEENIRTLDIETLDTTEPMLKIKSEYIIDNYPQIKSHTILLRICMSHFADIVKGEIPATDIMFPDSSLELVQGIYQGNSIADYYNNLVAITVEQFIQDKRKTVTRDEKIKILEIGAGTGGTTTHVLKKVAKYSDDIHYTYTDISKSFINFGQKHYKKQYDFLDFTLLDIENDVYGQIDLKQKYDIVVAANVIHATKNILKTLFNIKKILKSDGCLLLNELISNQCNIFLTFGLLDGWWKFNDSENRLKHSPLLKGESWITLLQKAGFKKAFLVNKNYNLFQNIIIGDTLEKTSSGISIIASPPETDKNINLKQNNMTAGNDSDDSDVVKKEIAQTLMEIFEVKIEDIDYEKEFSEYGIDSISAVKFINSLNNKFSSALKTIIIFNYPDIQSLADFIHKENNNTIQIKQVPVKQNNDEIDALQLLKEFEAGTLNKDYVLNTLENIYD